MTDYFGKQSGYRDTTVIIIPTTPKQDAKMIESLKSWEGVPLPDPLRFPGQAANDTCATRTNQALNAGGMHSVIAGPYSRSELSIKKSNPVPATLKAFDRK